MEKRFLKKLLIILIPMLFTSCNWMEPGITVLRGNYSYQSGKFQQATISYLKGLKSEKYEERIYYNMGNVFFSLGEAGAALNVWANVESTEELDLRYRLNFNKGVLFYQLGKYSDSYNMFKEALIANPSSIDAKINLELTLGKMAAGSIESDSKTSGPGSTGAPEETARILEYIKRKEGLLWFSSQKEVESNIKDW